jgi:hypothetical protein
MGELRKLDASELVKTLFDGAPGMDWELEKAMPNGERVLVPYRMQVLRVEENIDAIKCAQDYAKGKGELAEYGDIYREAQVYEILRRAVRHQEKREREDGTSYYPFVWVETSQLRSSLNEMEMAALLNAYQITKSHFGSVDGLDAHDSESWIARLSDPLKGPVSLSQLDSLHLPGMVLHLARVCRSLYEELGRELPSLEPSSDSAQESSTGSIGSSGSPPSASSTPNDLTTLGDRILTRDEALEIAKKRRRGGEPEPSDG